jgi:hypothetical protein
LRIKVAPRLILINFLLVFLKFLPIIRLLIGYGESPAAVQFMFKFQEMIIEWPVPEAFGSLLV